MMSISGAVLQGIAAMWTRRFLGLSAAVLLAMAGLGYGLHVAYADDAGRAIPTIGVTSPSPETIQVVWGAPGDTDTLNSYRVMWALEGQSHSYSEANTDTGGNAYPSADATSYTITGLAAGDYHVKVRARYDDNGSGPFKGSAVVRVAAAAEREAEDPDRSIPAIGVASPAAGTIEVIWGAPGDTDTLNSYRVMWAPEGQSHSYSEANTDAGGNAYPPADATSYTITGLAAGDYHVEVRARYDDNGSGPFKGSAVVRVEGTAEPAEEPEIAEQQQADPCASLEVAEVGGSASNGYALWVWKGSPVDDGVCWVDFKLSYSDDYGATFTEAAVVRRGMGAKASEYRYSIATVPELSIVSRLQVQVCAPDSDTCHHTLKSTDASLDQYYYSRHENKTAGANTKAVLVPANSSEGGNASVTGWLEYDDTETHTYRIAMTAGKTYAFDETYRKWAMMSGEWRGGEHYYLPDELRISLYTKNSAGELVPVSGFQNQPERGWQAIYEDEPYEDGTIDYQRFGEEFIVGTAGEFFGFLEPLITLFDNADFFPPGSQYRHPCTADPTNFCGPGLNIYKDKGRQLRTASYVPTKSGIYYLQVIRIRDDQPVYRESGGSYWSLAITSAIDRDYHMNVYGGIASGASHGLRSALPYYEISVEARGPTLTSIIFSGDSHLDDYGHQSFGNLVGASGSNQFGFLPGRFDYRVGLLSTTNTVTVAATAAHSDATVAFAPADADTSADGHQINTPGGVFTDVTITVTRGSDQETYTIKLSRP